LVGQCANGVDPGCDTNDLEFDALLETDEFKLDLVLHIQELNLHSGVISIKKIDYSMFLDPDIV
jgi:hypothetical protein